MPAGPLKNRLYRLALPAFGLMIKGSNATNALMDKQQLNVLTSIFCRHHVIGGCLQLIHQGKLGPLVTYGYSRLPNDMVQPDTVFRAASITKMVTAVGAMMLVEKNVLDLEAPIDQYLPYPVRNPRFPNQPILVKHLFYHTSGIWDGPLYDNALHSQVSLKTLLNNPMNYLSNPPGSKLRYSNLAAGIIGSLIEIVTNSSLESYMQESVFLPNQMNASYTLQHFVNSSIVACIYRVLALQNKKNAQYDPIKKRISADALNNPVPEYHYLPAAGNLFTDAVSLGKLVCMLINQESLLSSTSVQKMQTPASMYGKNAPHAQHCIGLVALDDPSLQTGRLYGHQGFAYGAAEGIFFQPSTGNGFVFLNSGASEARQGHLACVNRDLILWALSKDGYLTKSQQL